MTAFDLRLAKRQGAFQLEIDIRVEARALALFGPSGSGKTTTLELLAGLRTPDAGRIVIGGRSFFDRDAGLNVPARKRHVGYVPQEGLLFPHLSVRENIAYGSRSDAYALDLVGDLLELEALLSREVSSLSGGERQRVALARALNSAPEVLLLDEPLAAVDLPRRRGIVDALRRVRDERDIPIVFVTHAPEEVAALADVVVVMDSGRVAGVGPAASLERQ